MDRIGPEVDLLVADVVLPECSGCQFYEEEAAHHPGLKVLYVSGYTDNPIFQSDELKSAIHFLGKPFTAEDLARKVRGTLDA